jgi:hypothetical protein
MFIGFCVVAAKQRAAQHLFGRPEPGRLFHNTLGLNKFINSSVTFSGFWMSK